MCTLLLEHSEVKRSHHLHTCSYMYIECMQDVPVIHELSHRDTGTEQKVAIFPDKVD